MSFMNPLQQKELEMAAKRAELTAALQAKNKAAARAHLLRVQVSLSRQPIPVKSYGDLPTNSTFPTTGVQF